MKRLKRKDPTAPDIPDVREVLRAAIRHIDDGSWAWAERDITQALELLQRLREMQPR